MGYKSNSDGPSFGSACGCLVAPVAFVLLAAAFAIPAGAPNIRLTWFEIGLAAAITIGVTVGVFQFVRRMSDSAIEGQIKDFRDP